MTILTSVTEIEDRVVDTVKSIQEPVVRYIRESVDRFEDRLPKLPIPSDLPKASDVIDSQFDFAKDLLEAQRTFVRELADAVSPLVRSTEDEPEAPGVKDEPAPTAAAAKPKATPKKKA
jgi:cysteinyl-tRNA synthetase